MLTALAIAKNDLACYAKNRMAIFWTFLGPAVCMWFFGFLTPAASVLSNVTLIREAHPSALASRVLLILRQDGHVVTESDKPSASEISIEVQSSAPQITVYANANDTRAAMSLEYELKAALLPDQATAIQVDNKLAQANQTSTSGFQRTVPAYLIMFLTINLLMSGAGFAEERASGRIRRLLTAPISALTVIAGRLLSRLLIAWLQMLVLFSIGVFVLKVHWAEHSAGLIVMLSLYVVAMGSVGILIGSCFRDPAHASAFAMWAALILAPLTGLWWPIELMPKALQSLSHFLPTGWVMQSVNSMLVSNSGITDFQPALMGLVVVAIIATLVSASRLRTTAL